MTLSAALLLLASAAFGQAKAPSARLMDQDGRAHRFPTRWGARAIVIFSHAADCPEAFSTGAAAIDASTVEGVDVYLLDASSAPSRAALAREARRLGLRLPILSDASMTTAKALGFERTSEAVIVDPKGWRVFARVPAVDAKIALGDFLAGRIISLPKRSRGKAIEYPPAPPIGYAEDIAPILAARCGSCHFQPGASPRLHDHAAVAAWAPVIRESVMARRMPPWNADPDGPPVQEDPSLTPEELRALTAWVEAGAPRGTGGADPLAAAVKEAEDAPEWPDGPPDYVLEMESEQEIPADGFLRYRYIPLTPALKADLWLTRVVLKPGNRRVVHHVNLLALRAPLKSYERLDDSIIMLPQEDRDESLIMSLVPGREKIEAKTNVARRLRADRFPVLEAHYVATGKPERDLTRVGLYVYKGPGKPREIKLKIVRDLEFQVPPGAREHVIRKEWKVERDLSVLGLGAHMHLRGTRMSFTARFPDGRAEPLLSIPDYDFAWQRLYKLATPKLLPKGTVVEVEGAMDNSAENPRNPDHRVPARWGAQTTDEMFQGGILYVDE